MALESTYRVLCYWDFILPISQADIANAQEDGEATPIIYDADMGPMIDDVGGLAVLHALSGSNNLTFWLP